MLSHTLRMLIGIGSAVVMLLPALWPTPAEAQIVRRFRGGGVHVRAPLVRVNVGPYGATSVRAPFVAVDPGMVRIGLGRRRAPIPRPAAPAVHHPASPRPANPTAAPTAVEPAPFPSADELAAMDIGALLAALRGVTARLDEQLAQLATGAGWQRYLKLPEGALSESGINLDDLQRALARFDAVAENSAYAAIAGLPSFVASKAVLRQVIQRFDDGPQDDGPQIVAPTGADATPPASEAGSKDEILPTPTPAAQPEAASGERSILKRTSRD